ncbi:MAG: PQQ-dependent sugar dehydrogenase [Pseudomonadota bacterium]
MTPRFLFAFSALFASSFGLAQVPSDVTLEDAFGGANFNGPVAVRHAGDGSGRKFVVELDGIIRVVDASDNVLATPFLNATSITNASGERGLLGLAFHPNYAINGLLYVNYTDTEPSNGIPTGDTVIAEFQVSAGNPNVVDFSSRRQIIVIPQDFSNHNGGDIHFGPDGYLYIGMGDGGSGNDPCQRGQGLDSTAAPPGGIGCESGSAAWLLGKMLRLDVDNTTPAGSNNLCAANGDGSAPYAIPADNPFVGQSDRCGETWSYGLRNPFRFSFDRGNGDLWIGDVGQSTWEEISLLPAGSPAGADFGWKICEGTFQRGSTETPCSLANSILPVIEYANFGNPDVAGQGCSVAGGFRYRGPVKSLQGTYIYSDFCQGVILFAREQGPGNWVSKNFGSTFSNVYGFGEDEEGNLYVSLSNGDIRVFRGDTEPEGLIFRDRFED